MRKFTTALRKDTYTYEGPACLPACLPCLANPFEAVVEAAEPARREPALLLVEA